MSLRRTTPPSDLSWLNPTPHAIAVYASRPLSPGLTQHSLPSGRCPLLGRSTGWIAPACLAHSFNHLVGSLLAVIPDIGRELPVASNFLPYHKIFAGDFLW
jgi:hypothetical protein